MKKAHALIALVAFLAFAGCASMSPQNKSRINTSAQLAAYVGTVEALRGHPEYRKGFSLAVEQLKTLEAGPIDPIALMNIVNRLPVKELKSSRAQMIITAATILLTDEIGATPIEKLNDLKPVVTAIREGIERALASGI